VFYTIVAHSTAVPVWCGHDSPGTLDIEVGPKVGQHQLVEVGREAVPLLGGRPVQLVAAAATAALRVEAPGHATWGVKRAMFGMLSFKILFWDVVINFFISVILYAIIYPLLKSIISD
jgi:hypothetical protein